MKGFPPPPVDLPLPFGNRRASLEHDPDRLAQQVSRAVPLRDLSPRGSSARFVHRSVHVQACRLGITAAAHSPLHGANYAHTKAVFTLPTLGEKRFVIDGRSYHARAGHGALFLPGDAYTLETSHCSGVMFTLCPRELALVASAMAGPGATPFQPIERPLLFLESHPHQGRLLSLIRRSLQLIDLASTDGPSGNAHMGLDDKLQRLMALLIYPQLTSPPAHARVRLGKAQQDAFAALLEAMGQDPMGDWTLTRMERQACLSRTQLQQQFQAVFDRKPLEWLRHQRLCWARQRLDGPEPVALEDLARQCGYRDLETFSLHFEERFQVAPQSLSNRWTFRPG
ncbi:MAG: helix-turn-helix transcriptional regulator [Cyanobacteriota bacterium]|nr:helix-turn-helix transcriptional regulator [Cyanobacteriota bacterium]